MTTEPTLREKVETALRDSVSNGYDGFEIDYDGFTSDLATILESTNDPAHMRVAAELRGE